MAASMDWQISTGFSLGTTKSVSTLVGWVNARGTKATRPRTMWLTFMVAGEELGEGGYGGTL